MNLVLLQSIMVPVAASAIALATGKTLKEKTGWIVFAASLYVTWLLLVAALKVYEGGIVVEHYTSVPLIGLFSLVADGISAPIALTIALLSSIIAVYSIGYMRGEKVLDGYFALYLLYEAGMIGTVLSSNLVFFFIFFELMLIPSWALIAGWGTGDRVRAAFKYFIFTEAGALSVLAAIAITGTLSGTFDMFEVASGMGSVDVNLLVTVVSIFLLGFFIKMAIFPLHTWLPDTYVEASTPISALMSSAMTGIGGYGAIRILYTCFPMVLSLNSFTIVLAVLAFITMVYGGFMAYAQDDLKRLLAYSSISQMGYMLFGVASASTIGVLGAILLYIGHGLCKASLFLVSGIFQRQLKTKYLNELGGLAGRMPYTAIATLISFLGLAGVPPTLGFWSELYIFLGSVYTALSYSLDVYRLAITGLAVVASILSAGYGLWTVKRAFYGEEVKTAKEPHEAPPILLVPTFVLAVLAVLLGIYPTVLTKLFSSPPTSLTFK